MASTVEAHNTCIALRESNAATTHKHLLSRKNSHLACQSYICASIVQSLRDMYGNIDENSLRTDSGTVHCHAIEMFRPESPPVSGVEEKISAEFIKQSIWFHCVVPENTHTSPMEGIFSKTLAYM